MKHFTLMLMIVLVMGIAGCRQDDAGDMNRQNGTAPGQTEQTPDRNQQGTPTDTNR